MIEKFISFSSMANHTDTQAFDCRSQSSKCSSTPRGVENKGGNGNHCQQFQDTVLFDDTMALDSPFVETQLKKLEFDTQVVNDFDRLDDMRLQSISEYEEEVVLDSEDENICENKRVKVPNGLSDVNPLNLQERATAYVDQQCGVGNNGCGVNFERNDEQKDLYPLLTRTIGSQEPEESSQASALEFVDQFLSFNKVETSPGLDIKKTVWEKSPPVSRAKGLQSLVKRMKSRVTPLAKTRTFEWTNSDRHRKDDVFIKRIGAPFEFRGFKQRSVVRHQQTRYLNSKGGSSSGNEYEEKKELVNLHEEIAGLTHSDSRFIDHSPKETSRIEQESKLNLENNFVEEFNKDLHAESTEPQLDAPETFDVGFNTQIAAEAMEALSYGPCAGSIDFDSYQGPLNTTEDSLKGITVREAHLGHNSLSMSDLSDLGGIASESNRRKRTARKSGKKSNNRKLDHELVTMTKVRRGDTLIGAGKQFNCGDSANFNENSGRRPSKLMMQRQLGGTVGRKNEKCENYPSSLSVEHHILLGKEQAQREVKISSSIAHETRQTLAGDTLKRTSDQSDNPGEKTQDGILKYRRKRSRSVVNPTKVASATGRCSDLFSDFSAEARNSKLSQEELSCKEVTDITSCLKLDSWNHRKRKRTVRKGRTHLKLKSSDSYTPLAMVNGNVGKSCYIKSQTRRGNNDKTSYYDIDTKGIAHSVLHSSSWYSSEKNLSKKFEPGSAVVISNSESAIMCKRFFPTEPDRRKKFMQSGKVSNVAEKIHKFGLSSNKNPEPPASGYHKRPFNKNLPKSSFLKELIRLGVTESIPDFTWKDLRRRRDMAYVRVLFSQHLDDNVIKQQKKISARLGMSIATCPMDATHFVADRFVRTRNMLEAIALGKPVVTPLWLESCRQASCLIDDKNYILRDAKKEKEIGFSMLVSFARANQHPLLKGLRVLITPNIKPPQEMIASLVKAVHGQLVEGSQISAAKDKAIRDGLLILSCEEDHAFCMPFLDKGVAAYGSELLLNGIVIQKLEFERHRLFKNHGKRNQSSTR